jgi:3-dehydroquinate synthase
MSCQTVTVKLKHTAYPIYVGKDIFANHELLAKHIHGQQVLIVTQENIAHHYLSPLKEVLKKFQCQEIFLPGGEVAKNLQEWQRILDILLQHKYERSCTLIALGGGVVGDVTGFAAACYQRGVNYIQIPTTLMSQVDSSIGGKTAVNHAQGKNLIGAFHQPQCVIADVDVLQTLPQHELVAGLAEVIKYGLIADINFFVWLENNISSLLQRDTESLLHAITLSAAIKADIVSQDEKEHGRRSLLNLGHTFGHALETACAYQGLRHGEAVALGIAMAAELSHLLNNIDSHERDRIMRVLQACNLINTGRALPLPTEMLQLMQHDKKVQNGKLNLILLKKIGEAEKTAAVDEAKIICVMDKILKAAY